MGADQAVYRVVKRKRVGKSRADVLQFVWLFPQGSDRSRAKLNDYIWITVCDMGLAI
jgi:hypothetical protein